MKSVRFWDNELAADAITSIDAFFEEHNITSASQILEDKTIQLAASMLVSILAGKVCKGVDRDILNAIHDCALEALGHDMPEEALVYIYQNLPSDILGGIAQWGASDTVVRDNIYTFIKENTQINEEKE